MQTLWKKQTNKQKKKKKQCDEVLDIYSFISAADAAVRGDSKLVVSLGKF